jgi:hypothetical protein
MTQGRIKGASLSHIITIKIDTHQPLCPQTNERGTGAECRGIVPLNELSQNLCTRPCVWRTAQLEAVISRVDMQT